MVDTFPSEAREFNDSLASTLLNELSKYGVALQDDGLGLNACLHAVELARPVLSALAELCSVEELSEDSPAETSPKLRRKTQRMAKKAKRAAYRPNVDESAFERVGVPVPASKGEALSLSQSFLDDQLNILIVGSYTSVSDSSLSRF